MTNYYKQPVSVLVIVYSNQGEVLLLERADHPGFWQSITGSRETSDTSLIVTAAREVQEEIGLTLSIERLDDWGIVNHYEIYPQWRHRYAPDVTRNEEHVFGLCIPKVTPILLAPREHTSYQWCSIEKAITRVFSPSNASAFEYLSKRINHLETV